MKTSIVVRSVPSLCFQTVINYVISNILNRLGLDVVAHTCNPRIQEAEEGGFQIKVQLGLYNKQDLVPN